MIGQKSPPKVSAPAGRGGERWMAVAICFVLATITLVVFGQAAGFDFINFDDPVYVSQNARVLTGLSWGNIVWTFSHADASLYHPLTMLSLMADYQMHGLRAGGYHLANVLLHAASVILLFLILRSMTGAIWRSTFVTTLFAVHPLRVESVVWVAERKDVLSAFFFMVTLAAYVHYVRQPKSWLRYLSVLVAFVLALLSKPTVVTLPFVLLLLDYWPLRRKEGWPQLVREKIPLLALSGAACVATILAARVGIAAYSHSSLDSHLAGGVVAGAVYLRQMVWPAGLAVFYPAPKTGYPAGEVAGAALLLTAITLAVLLGGRRRRWLFTGWFWYLGMLVPMLGIVQASEFAHADRSTYLPMIGLCMAVVWLIAELPLRASTLGALGAGAVALLMFCSWQQTALWQNSESLWSYTLACTSDNSTALNNLGLALMADGKLEAAINRFKEALEIKPDFVEAHDNLGNALLQTGDIAGSILHCERALELKPNDAEAHVNLGNALFRNGQSVEAIKHYNIALGIDPGLQVAQKNINLINTLK